MPGYVFKIPNVWPFFSKGIQGHGMLCTHYIVLKRQYTWHFFYLRQTLTTQIVQNILLNMSRLHMMMHDLHSKGHLTVKVIEGQTVFMDIWIFVNITTKWSDICINTIY